MSGRHLDRGDTSLLYSRLQGQNFLFYSHTTDYNKAEVVGFLAGFQMLNLSGKQGTYSSH